MLHALRWISWALTLGGIATLAAAAAFDLDLIFVLTGVMLAWTGVVKIVVLRLWTGVAGLGSERHDPIQPD